MKALNCHPTLYLLTYLLTLLFECADNTEGILNHMHSSVDHKNKKYSE